MASDAKTDKVIAVVNEILDEVDPNSVKHRGGLNAKYLAELCWREYPHLLRRHFGQYEDGWPAEGSIANIIKHNREKLPSTRI